MRGPFSFKISLRENSPGYSISVSSNFTRGPRKLYGTVVLQELKNTLYDNVVRSSLKIVQEVLCFAYCLPDEILALGPN